MDVSFLLAAAEQAAAAAEHGAAGAEHHKSEAPFFIAGGVLSIFAVIVSVYGFTRPDFPTDDRTARGVMALGAVLVGAAMFSAVYVAI